MLEWICGRWSVPRPARSLLMRSGVCDRRTLPCSQVYLGGVIMYKKDSTGALSLYYKQVARGRFLTRMLGLSAPPLACRSP